MCQEAGGGRESIQRSLNNYCIFIHSCTPYTYVHHTLTLLSLTQKHLHIARGMHEYILGLVQTTLQSHALQSVLSSLPKMHTAPKVLSQDTQ